MKTNLKNLSIFKAAAYINNILLPNHYWKGNADEDDDDDDNDGNEEQRADSTGGGGGAGSGTSSSPVTKRRSNGRIRTSDTEDMDIHEV